MDLQQRARTIIETNLALQPGETLLVVTDDPTREVGELFYEAARAMDHRALIMQMPEGSVAGEEPPAPVAAAMKAADVALCPTAKSITHTNARIKAAAAGTRVVTMPGITMDMLRDGAACADYDQVERRTRQLTERLTHAKHARIEKDGHVLELALTGRDGVASPGVYREPGASGNFPSGEAYIAPLEDGANGTAVIDGSMVGIGTNEAAKLCGIILEDEKLYGTVHIAFGTNTSFGGITKADCHLDGIILNPTLYLDDECVIRKGEFL